jgi:hypothetical protein
MFGLLCDACEVICDAKQWVQKKSETSLQGLESLASKSKIT